MAGKPFFFFVLGLIGVTTLAVGYFFVSVKNHRSDIQHMYQKDISAFEMNESL